MYKTNTGLPHERETLIRDATGESKETHTFYEYQNKPTDLPLIRIDIAMPIYRMANYRTRTAQLKFVHDHRKHPDFFSAGEDNESAQQAQHDILTEYAKQGRSTSVSPIMSELEAEEQREPLLITKNGVVVNGNRRLAAMRELFTERPGRFKRFSHVDCAVLPASITPDEIREIEVRLQMRPETKLPYGWIEESIAIQDMIDSGHTPGYVADLMKKRKKDVERAARALKEVDIYLKEWLHRPGDYQLVEAAQQFFNDLAKALDGKEGEVLEASRRVAWVLISNSKDLGRRIYDYNFSFDRRSGDVFTALSDRLGIDLGTRSPNSDTANDDDLDINLGDDKEGTSLEQLIEAFDDPKQRDEISAELIDVCDSIIEQDRQGEVGRRALVTLQAVNKKLLEVDISTASSATYNAIEKQLETVRARVERLSKTLEPYKDTEKNPARRR